MSATTTERVSAVAGARLSAFGIVRSEWTKLRSLRSTVWSLVAAVLLIVGLGAIISAATNSHWAEMRDQERAQFDATMLSLAGGFLAQLAIGVLGVLLISGEYTTGMIRSTMTAVPRRLPALWAKVAVFAVVTFLTTVAAAFAAFGVGQRLLHSTGHTTSLSQPGVARAVLGLALYLTVVGVLGMALGALLRHSAGSIASLFGVLLIVPILANFLPRDWQARFSKFLPSEAGQQILTVVRANPHELAPWAGIGLFAGYAVAVLAIAAFLLTRRDV